MRRSQSNYSSGVRRVGGARLLLFALFGASVSAGAQGVAGASVYVHVSARGAPVTEATVALVSYATGATRSARTGRDGFARFQAIEVGAYRIDARAIGFKPATVDSVSARLGDRVVVEAALNDLDATQLPGVAITVPPSRDVSHGGPSGVINREQARYVPVLNRDFTSLFSLTGQALGRTPSISGQNFRFNSILIDGAAANDLFGTGVTPGSNAGARSMSLEAIDELRVSVAPFDVRYGGFTGGLISGVTKSGTNQRQHRAYSLYSRSGLTGRDTAGVRESPADQRQVGFSSGGPIVRGRLHYFGLVETEDRTRLHQDNPITDPATGITRATADSVRRLTQSLFGFDPGNAEAVELDQPNANTFLKVSWQASARHAFTVSHSFLSARSEGLVRSARSSQNSDGFQLSESGSVLRTRTMTSVLKSVNSWTRVTHEGILSLSSVRDVLDSRQRTPLFLVQGDVPGNYVAAGSVVGAQGTRTKYRSIEATSNTTLSLGSHLITLGTQNLFTRTDDNFVRGAWGVWSYPGVDAFARSAPSLYEVTLPLNGGPRVNMNATRLSAYAQDEWQVTDALTLAGGVRYDHSLTNRPPTNTDLAERATLGNIDTGDFPSSYGALAPRVSLAFTPGADRRTVVRAGIGTFVGRLPLVWLGNAFSGTGQQSTILTCRTMGSVPAPTVNIDALPTNCLTQGTRTVPTVTSFDPRFRMHQATKYAVGLDRDLGFGISATLDLVLTRSRDNLGITDDNLVPQGTNAEGRAMYGSLAATGAARVARRDIAYGPVYRLANVSGERSTSAAATMRRTWSDRGIAQVSYTWSRAEDVMSVVGNNGVLMFRNNPVDGSLEQRALRRSGRDVPHTLIAMGTLPMGKRTTATLLYRLRSGLPYAYTIGSDVNADGGTRNDLARIPKDSSDISLSNPAQYGALERFIRDERCLRDARGRLMTRNSCRNPMVQVLDFRVTQAIRLHGSQRVELDADLFNVLNALRPNWGLVRETSDREDVPLLNVSGWDTARNRPVYAVPARDGIATLPSRRRVLPNASKWRMQLGARWVL
jgi:hypothetical protein